MIKNNMKLKDLKTSELIVDEFNVRKGQWNPNDDDETKLVDSVKAQGILEPLLVRPVKGQSSKYAKNKTYSIICGSRRWRAAMEARQKDIPCVIRTDLNDIQSLGTSIQENLKRRSMDKTQTADGVGKMMDMMNGGRTYEQKMRDMTKMFGMKKDSINIYWNIYKLKKQINPKILVDSSQLDTHTLSNIETAKHWDKEDKEKAIEVLSKIEQQKDRVVALSEMKKKTKQDEEMDVKEAYDEYEQEVDDTVGQSFDVYLNAKERKATKDAGKKENLEINTLIKRNHVDWLKSNNYL